jgi:hypothetical protein
LTNTFKPPVRESATQLDGSGAKPSLIDVADLYHYLCQFAHPCPKDSNGTEFDFERVLRLLQRAELECVIREMAQSLAHNAGLDWIPDTIIFREAGRRRAARRTIEQMGGRPAVKRLCPHCGKEFGTMELRMHTPRCPVRIKEMASRRHPA